MDTARSILGGVAAEDTIAVAKVDKALEALDRALSVCSQNAELRMLRADAYERKGDLAQAIGDFT